MYLNDFQESLSKSYSELSKITEQIYSENICTYLQLFAMLYADDTILLAESPAELQKALTALQEYCEKWSLTVNTLKTKIMICSRGKVRKYPKFLFSESEIEVVEDYNYLGCKISCNNKFAKAKNVQVNQARRALFSLTHKCYNLDLPIDIQSE